MINAQAFTPFFGVVEDVNDPKKQGRYRVRVYGYNSENKGILPTEVLKWFPISNSNSASLGGEGWSPTGLTVGTLVFGMYLDTDKQEGLILGGIAGEGDVSAIATGAGGAYLEALRSGAAVNVPDARGESWSEPTTAYATQYPNNRVMQTKSGHVIELDDTPGAERVVIFHKSGSFEEYHPDGKKVVRNKGESFSIHLGGHNIFVNGDLNLVASGDYRVSVGGEYYIKARNVVVDTAVMDVYGISNANDHVSSGISGADHIHPGVQTGNGTTAPPAGKVTAFSPTPANNFYIEVEDTGYTPEAIAFAIEEGFMTEEEAQEILTAEPVVDGFDETPTEQVRVEMNECGIEVPADGKVDYNVRLSPNFILRDVSIGAVVSQNPIVAQRGLTKNQIICNLKNVAENILEPIKAKYPNMIVTSAFRPGNGTSQHQLGEAVDIQFPGFSKAAYFEAAQWVKNNVPYDQFLLEYKSHGTQLPWLHLSLKNGREQRYQVMTFFNHRKAHDGLVKLQ